jgi:hypothetical protein
MSQLNQAQGGFLKWLAAAAASLLGGWALMMIADSRIAGIETAADVATYSGLNTVAGLLFMVSGMSSIATLIYGRRHELAIRELKNFSRLLTAFRILFWISVIASLLAAAFLIWIAMHIGPVR